MSKSIEINSLNNKPCGKKSVTNKVTKLVGMGNIHLLFTLRLPSFFFDNLTLDFDNIETITDLQFLFDNKQLWNEITWSSNNANLNFLLQWNRGIIDKIFVSYIVFSKITYSAEQEFFSELVKFVTERNWWFLNYEDICPCNINLILNWKFGDRMKSFNMCQSVNIEINSCPSTKPKNSSNNINTNLNKDEVDKEELNNKEDENLLFNLSEDKYNNFDFIFTDIGDYYESEISKSISINNWSEFIIDLKTSTQIVMINYIPNVLTGITTPEQVYALHNIFVFTDIFLFERNEAYQMFNFLNIVLHKDNAIPDAATNSSTSKASNKGAKKSNAINNEDNSNINILHLDKKDSFKFFASDILSQCPINFERKFAIFMDEFNRVYILSITNSVTIYEYDSWIYPKINHYKLNVVNEYKTLINDNYEYYWMIFFAGVLGTLLPSFPHLNVKSIYFAYLTGVESTKKILEWNKNNLDSPVNPNFYLVKLPINKINSDLNDLAQKIKESNFKLDCVNRENSVLKFYNSLFDTHLNSYFTTNTNQKALRQKGFINSNGYIMYDSVYRELIGNMPKGKNKPPINEKMLIQYINHINIGNNIKSKEVDSLDQVLKKNIPINKKLPGLTGGKPKNSNDSMNLALSQTKMTLTINKNVNMNKNCIGLSGGKNLSMILPRVVDGKVQRNSKISEKTTKNNENSSKAIIENYVADEEVQKMK